MNASGKFLRDRKTKMFVLFALLALVILLFLWMRVPILLAVGDFLIIEDELHPADMIHVISGLDYRTEYAIRLMKEGYAKQIFFTGSWCEEVRDDHAARGRRLALSAGIAPFAILTDSTEIISTYEEATRLKVLIAQRTDPVRSVMIVSDPFHMRRAKWTYRKVLGNEIEIQMAPVPFEMTPFRRRWWEDWASRRNVQEEYIKYIYYLLRYGLHWEPLSNWLATFDQE